MIELAEWPDLESQLACESRFADPPSDGETAGKKERFPGKREPRIGIWSLMVEGERRGERGSGFRGNRSRTVGEPGHHGIDPGFFTAIGVESQAVGLTQGRVSPGSRTIVTACKL